MKVCVGSGREILFKTEIRPFHTHQSPKRTKQVEKRGSVGEKRAEDPNREKLMTLPKVRQSALRRMRLKTLLTRSMRLSFSKEGEEQNIVFFRERKFDSLFRIERFDFRLFDITVVYSIQTDLYCRVRCFIEMSFHIKQLELSFQERLSF